MLVNGTDNRRRIRFLRSRTQHFALNSGSHTTRRVTGEAATHIAHPLILEHRPPPKNEDARCQNSATSNPVGDPRKKLI